MTAMEEFTEAVNNMSISEGAVGAGGEGHKKNRIQISNHKKPLFFYVNLTKYIQLHNEGGAVGPRQGVSRYQEANPAEICLLLGALVLILREKKLSSQIDTNPQIAFSRHHCLVSESCKG